ncbi:MAG TPA: type II toxin-antitoxin system VapB family antitoxin [Candidatus Hydrogenedentes bacterium]|nr:type II toxin-antitoxin system VapB family antitoxin [Candidatus Hydrogenedentota bacterium]
MPTNLAIDDRLIEEAQKVGGHKTKKAAVTAALQNYITQQRQLEVLNLFGTVDFDSTYDHKTLRKVKRT